MTDTIVALDLGTKTGWAVHARGIITSGTLTMAAGRFDGGGMRFLKFRRWLDTLLAELGGEITALHFEAVRRHAGTDAAHVYGGLQAVLTSWCEEKQVPYSGVGVGVWKRHVVGKGNASKDDVKHELRRRGHDPADDNEADAIAIALWATETAGGVG
ncbi:crossover junction endodeoxyribonuclease RuvC [Roseospira goensis]|uniref:Holliday junction resolvasome RuvABC endonuclease subunit n=1 Tax=Roseospira goensis TaxID=391922 RepID=A0A7W6S3G0_9PROT|nr:hypothetical protein [Roseospira goensis]MBB4287680.1 Holliday junction resolvasome RuvABC endonuclease subunit [Roseospira goensis]